ncbi:MAG: hypothetical protein L6R39_001034 [Caloplaca ligustica]|nr:MAG: hypothetical protein L6R39_001034 [Caloplaca ligustica]
MIRLKSKNLLAMMTARVKRKQVEAQNGPPRRGFSAVVLIEEAHGCDAGGAIRPAGALQAEEKTARVLEVWTQYTSQAAVEFFSFFNGGGYVDNGPWAKPGKKGRGVTTIEQGLLSPGHFGVKRE